MNKKKFRGIRANVVLGFTYGCRQCGANPLHSKRKHTKQIEQMLCIPCALPSWFRIEFAKSELPIKSFDRFNGKRQTVNLLIFFVDLALSYYLVIWKAIPMNSSSFQCISKIKFIHLFLFDLVLNSLRTQFHERVSQLSMFISIDLVCCWKVKNSIFREASWIP